MREQQVFTKPDGTGEVHFTYVRVYLDGLVAYVYLRSRSVGLTDEYFAPCIGIQDKSVVFLYEFERSRAAGDMREMIVKTEEGRITAVGA
jgi:hypothetical protein